MRQLVIFFAAVLLSVTSLAAPVPNEALVRQQLEQAEANKNTPIRLISSNSFVLR